MQGTIYKITCTQNQKIYIGQTKQHYLFRFSQHKSHARNYHSNHKLARAIRKYGEDNFVIEIIEECDIDLLNERERYWIQFYDSTNDNKGYNVNLGGQDYSGYYQVDNEQEIIDYYLKCHNQIETFKHFNITEYKFRQILTKNNVPTDLTNYGKHTRKKIKILELNKTFDSETDCAKFLLQNNFTKATEKSVRVGISRSVSQKCKYLKLTFIEV